MDYEQKYKEALSRARVVNPGTKDYNIVTTIFPELKKSDDERIRENAIQIIRYSMSGTDVALPLSIYKECIAWLEKQGEQKSQGKSAFEAAKEEKIDDANKVESKFKAGDWIISNDSSRLFRRIVAVDKSGYGYTTDCGYYNHNYYDNNFHLRTITDAKDGDVLEFGDHGRPVVGIVSYVNKTIGKVDVSCLLENNNFKMGNYYNLDTTNPHPATKKQYDLLFQKMKEAGYKWDSDKKELIKYE